MGRLFGTDGVRGRFGDDLTIDLATRLGQAAAVVLGRGHPSPKVLIGRDTRASGPLLEQALIAGIARAGGEGIRAGIIPTAGVAYLTGAYGCQAGAVISASHNSSDDNGIKFFGADGMKLADAIEDEIESVLEHGDGEAVNPGRGADVDDAEERYLGFLLEGAPDLSGLHVVVDCANGAAFHVAPEAYRRAGATVTAIFAEPDGRNINDGCGSTHPETLQLAVAEKGAHVGIAHDGDADRLIAVDELGSLVDGDQILAACAIDAKARGLLPGDAVVSTVMANLGFRRAMSEAGIAIEETAVGDRYVLERMIERGIAMGGEQSGHLIFLEKHSTGDGILTAIRLLGLMASSGKPLSALAALAPRAPQVLLNVRDVAKDRLDDASAVWDEVLRVEQELGSEGRVLVRPSGTEQVVRVMVEATSEDAAQAAAERIAKVVLETLAR
ncbi:MAG: phosphoglucosamine mutase [Actinomycetota bacterium]